MFRGVEGRAILMAVDESHLRLMVGDAARRTAWLGGNPLGVRVYVWLNALARGGACRRTPMDAELVVSAYDRSLLLQMDSSTDSRLRHGILVTV